MDDDYPDDYCWVFDAADSIEDMNILIATANNVVFCNAVIASCKQELEERSKQGT